MTSCQDLPVMEVYFGVPGQTNKNILIKRSDSFVSLSQQRLETILEHVFQPLTEHLLAIGIIVVS